MAVETGGSSPDRPGWFACGNPTAPPSALSITGGSPIVPLSRTKKAATREGGRSFALIIMTILA